MDIVQQELDQDILKVTLKGSLDVAGAGIADEVLGPLAAARKKLIADLGGVDFVASAGIRVLVKTAKTMGGHGGKFAIVNPNDMARRVMWTTGLDRIVPIADDEQAAIGAVS